MKILGFRSKKGWKMGLATFGYGFILMVIIIAIIDPSTEETTAPVEAEETTPVEDVEEEVTKPEEEEAEVDAETIEANQYSSMFELSNSFIRQDIGRLGQHLQVFAYNEMWKDEYYEYVEELTEWAQDLRDMENVPDKFEFTHEAYLEGVDDVLASLDMMTNAIETEDDGDLDYAVVVMERGIEKMNSAEEQYKATK
ncbi:hypothetical protein [Halalkalibacter flavus]|uniref:hypothetical protein n=1 Tax=Halalkalibacter flavus TaxID=3090668 RepID=UPI002FCBE4FD